MPTATAIAIVISAGRFGLMVRFYGRRLTPHGDGRRSLRGLDRASSFASQRSRHVPWLPPGSPRRWFGLHARRFEGRVGNPSQAGSNQGCGIRKCATTVRARITGTANTVLRDIPPSHRFALGRSSSPTMTVASSAKRIPALISDARKGNNCGGHTAGRLAEQAQPGRTGCAIQSTNKPRRTTQAATAGERVAPRVLLGMSPDYRSGTPVARQPRRRGRRRRTVCSGYKRYMRRALLHCA